MLSETGQLLQTNQLIFKFLEEVQKKNILKSKFVTYYKKSVIVQN